MQLLIGLAIVGLDQLVKWLLWDQAVLNRGLAFGLLSEQPFAALLLLGSVAGYAGWLATRPEQLFLARLGWTFVLAGLTSNLIDRIRIDAVIDVVSIGSWFPTFNVADSSIVLGLSLVFLTYHHSR